MKKFLKQYKSKSSYLPILLDYMNNLRFDKYSNTKKIALKEEKEIKKIIATLDEDSINLYYVKSTQLIQAIKIDFDSIILNSKKNKFISKYTGENYAIFIDCSSFTNKKVFLANSSGK